MTGTAVAAVLCGAKKKGGGTCANHPLRGQARCKFHKGRPITHGRYSALIGRSDRIAALVEELAEDPDPLDTIPELVLTRALLRDWVERYSETMEAILAWHASSSSDNPRPATIPDITEAVRLISEISKGAKRERDTQNVNWISRKDLRRLLVEILEVFRLHAVDDEQYEAVRAGMVALAVKS